MKYFFISRQFFSLPGFLRGVKKISTIFGLGCYKHPCATYKISYYGLVMLLITLSFNGWKIHGIFTQTIPSALSTQTTDKILSTVSAFTYLMSFICSSVIKVLSFFTRKRLFDMLKRFEEFDQEIQRLNISINNLRDIGLLLIFWIIKLMSLIIAIINPNSESFGMSLIMLFSVIDVYIQVEIYIAIIYLIRRRVYCISNALR